VSSTALLGILDAAQQVIIGGGQRGVIGTLGQGGGSLGQFGFEGGGAGSRLPD